MKAVIQRVKEASVSVDGKVVGDCKQGYMILLGAAEGDTLEDVEVLARKTANLRVFCDENDKMNKSILDIDGEILAISQFTLCADVKKGNRPSFIHARLPEMAEPMFNYIADKCRAAGMSVETGVFGSFMKVSLVNDGPFTIVLDSDQMGWS